MTMPGLPGGGQNSSVIQQMDITVTKEPGSDRKLAEMKYVAVKAMMNMGGQLMTYDSTDPAMSQPMLQQAFGAIIGKSITFVFDKDDQYVDVIVPEGFMPTPLGMGRGPDGKQLGEMMRDTVQFGLPGRELAIGDTFDIEKKMNMPPVGSIATKIKGRFDSIVDHEGRKHAKLLTKGTIETPETPGGAPNLVSMLAGAKVTGETLFDIERKQVTRTTATTEVKMTAAGREVTMKQTTVSNLKSVEDAPAPKK
jgi:hypothetical protein